MLPALHSQALGGWMEHVVGARARHGRTENMPEMLLGHLRQTMHHALLDPPEASVLLFSESPIHVIERVTLQSVLVPLRVGNSQYEPCSGCHMDAWAQGEQSARTQRNPCHCGSVFRLLLCRGQDLAVQFCHLSRMCPSVIAWLCNVCPGPPQEIEMSQELQPA